MRIERVVDLGARQVTVRELTVSELRAWLAAAEDAPPAPTDALGALLIEGMGFADLARLTDLTQAEMEGLAPSELAAVASAAREVNAGFFALLARASTIRAPAPPPGAGS